MNGREALAEAARREAAAFYGRPAGDTSRASRLQLLADDERAVADALDRAAINAAIRRGSGVAELVDEFALTRMEAMTAIRTARRTA